MMSHYLWVEAIPRLFTNKNKSNTDKMIRKIKKIVSKFRSVCNNEYSIVVSKKTGCTAITRIGPCRLLIQDTGEIVGYDDSKLVFAQLGCDKFLEDELRLSLGYDGTVKTEDLHTSIIRTLCKFVDRVAATGPDFNNSPEIGSKGYKNRLNMKKRWIQIRNRIDFLMGFV